MITETTIVVSSTSPTGARIRPGTYGSNNQYRVPKLCSPTASDICTMFNTTNDSKTHETISPIFDKTQNHFYAMSSYYRSPSPSELPHPGQLLIHSNNSNN